MSEWNEKEQRDFDQTLDSIERVKRLLESNENKKPLVSLSGIVGLIGLLAGFSIYLLSLDKQIEINKQNIESLQESREGINSLQKNLQEFKLRYEKDISHIQEKIKK